MAPSSTRFCQIVPGQDTLFRPTAAMSWLEYSPKLPDQFQTCGLQSKALVKPVEQCAQTIAAQHRTALSAPALGGGKDIAVHWDSYTTAGMAWWKFTLLLLALAFSPATAKFEAMPSNRAASTGHVSHTAMADADCRSSHGSKRTAPPPVNCCETACQPVLAAVPFLHRLHSNSGPHLAAAIMPSTTGFALAIEPPPPRSM